MLLSHHIYHRIPERHKANVLLDARILLRQPARHAKPLNLILSANILQADIRNGGHGYIAGTADGIVTVAGQPAVREIWVLAVHEHRIIRSVWSNAAGNYLVPHLNPTKEYLIICRDHEKQYEPFCYDYVKPATDLTVAEQQALWQSWQTSSTNNTGSTSSPTTP